MKRRLIKFDIVHPREYLEQKKKSWPDLSTISRQEYLNRLIRLRSNYSDFYTYHLNPDEWEAEEFFLLDNTFLDKTARELFGSRYRLIRYGNSLRNKLRLGSRRWRDYVIHKYIEKVKPDAIFVRSQPLPSDFWQRYRENTLLVSRLSARLPVGWHPNHWDLIYTDQPDFQKFFELHGVRTILNDQGFDDRIVDELITREKKHEVSFVGGLGTQNFLQRTNFINRVAPQIDFQWWGYWWQYGGDGRQLEDFSALHRTFRGRTSGLEMFQIFKDSKVVINDYVDTANGIGFNQRMFEVMGSGAFMLTRNAPNFEGLFPPNIFATYENDQDFLDKIAYYLEHEREREEIAKNGQQFVLEHYNYRTIVEQFGRDLTEELTHKSLHRA